MVIVILRLNILLLCFYLCCRTAGNICTAGLPVSPPFVAAVPTRQIRGRRNRLRLCLTAILSFLLYFIKLRICNYIRRQTLHPCAKLLFHIIRHCHLTGLCLSGNHTSNGCCALLQSPDCTLYIHCCDRGIRG